MDISRTLTPRPVRAIPWVWLGALAVLLAPLAFGWGSASPSASNPGLDPGRLAGLGWNSIRMSAGAALLALIWAVPVAVSATRVLRPRHGALLIAISCIPLFVPPAVLAVAAVRLAGPSGFLTEILTHGEVVFPVTEQIRGPAPKIPGAPIYTLAGGAAVLAWSFLPLCVLALASALARRPGGLEREALMDAGPLTVLARVSMRLAAGGAALGTALVFLFSLVDLSVPEALRSLPVLVAEVYVQFGVYFDTRSALAASLTLVAMTVAVAAGVTLLGRLAGLRTMDEPGDMTESFRFPRTVSMRLLSIAGWSAAAIPVLAAMGILAATATGPQGPGPIWEMTFRTTHEEFVYTLQLALILAAMTGVWGTVTGWALSACSRGRSMVWKAVILSPLILPAPILGVAVQVLLRRPVGSLPLGLDGWLADLSGTPIPLLLVWTLRFGSIVALLTEYLARRIPRETFEAALLDGAGGYRCAFRLGLPQVWPAMAAGMLAAFALSLGEVGAAILLVPPGTTTLGVRLMTLMHTAPTGQVSALCLLLLVPGVLAYAAGAAIWSLARRLEP